jgi:hypothetical protein
MGVLHINVDLHCPSHVRLADLLPGDFKFTSAFAVARHWFWAFKANLR